MALLIVTLSACLAAGLARWGLLRLEPDEAVRARVPLAGLGAITLGTVWLAFALASPVPSTIAGIGPVLLAGLLMQAAWIDRQTTWVPDEVLVPVLLVAGVHVAGGTVGIALGIGLWLLALVAWRVQRALGRQFLTPPDLIAAVLPILLLGISFSASLFYFGAALLALALLKSRMVRRVFVNEAATREGATHLGLSQDRPALPALTLLFPLLAPIFLVRGELERLIFELYY